MRRRNCLRHDSEHLYSFALHTVASLDCSDRSAFFPKPGSQHGPTALSTIPTGKSEERYDARGMGVVFRLLDTFD